VLAKILHGISSEDYYADRLPDGGGPSLSSSIAKILLEKTPEQARLAHPRLRSLQETEDYADDSSDAKDAGSLTHRLVLGKGASLAIVDFEDWRTKAAKAARDEARAAGKIPVLKRIYDEAFLSSRRIRERLHNRGVLLDGESEMVFQWSEKALDGTEVRCRAAMDHVRFGVGKVQCIDIKTLESARPDMCQWHVGDYDHDVQFAAYESALRAISDPALQLDFLFAFVEREPPNIVTIAEFSEKAKAFGRMRWQIAVDRWADCLKLGSWRAYYEPGRVQLDIPNRKVDRWK
jgi:PDDEXK-like domain of unknown function (DUF3799)